MANPWIITVDHEHAQDPTGPNNVGRCSTGYTGDGSDLPKRFRLQCDDEVVYEGRQAEDDFHPLDDFGRGYYGCNELRYFENGAWKPL